MPLPPPFPADCRLVVFDLDGTLLDTLDDLADSANEALAAAGYPVHPTDSYRTFVGDGIHTLIERILPQEQRTGANVEKVLGLYQAAYGRNWKAKSRPYAGILDLIDTLRELGIPQAVLSNKPQSFTTLCLDHHLPGHPFHPALGQRAEVPRKPDPAGALEIAESLGVLPHQCYFVGDTSTDMLTATAAGMIAVGVTWGFRSAEELRETGASLLVDTPAELAALCGAPAR